MLAIECILNLWKVLVLYSKNVFIWNDVGYFVLLDVCNYKLFRSLSKLLASLMSNYFPKRPSGAPLLTLSKLCDASVWFCTTPPPILKLCIALFAVAEGWLLLDIGLFVLFYIFWEQRSRSQTKLCQHFGSDTITCVFHYASFICLT